MNFDNPQMVESIAYDLKLADWPRGLQRARINDIANGKPPYTKQEVEENAITVNVNDLTHTRSMQQARSQFYSAFLKPAHFFTAKLDSGPRHKRQEWSASGTSIAARVMKRSLPYFECMRSRFMGDVLHGVGPSAWEDRDKWCPDPLGIEDCLLPVDTLLTMKNLPFFFLYKSMTAPELIKLTTGPRVDPGWNIPLVESCLRWMDTQMMARRNSDNMGYLFSPEKTEERIKQGEWYAGDQAPRIDCFDFYFWTDEGKRTGWRRRMILDPWSVPQAAGAGWTMSRRSDALYNQKTDKGEAYGGFLFNPGTRVYARKLSELVTFQFADLSAVNPPKYHSVRSLGWLLHAVCHMQNRLRCAANRHLFENLMQYFRGKSEEDFQRALKVMLVNNGFIDDSIQMIPQAERFQIQAALLEMGLNENRQIIDDSVSNWAQSKNYSSDRTEKTKFQVMAEVGASTGMISAALLQAYAYQGFEYQVIWERMMKKNSRDPDCREVRAAMMREGVPEEMLEAERWIIEPERVMGAGNKTMEMAIAEWLMANRMAYDSQAQQEILRDVTLLVTDDATRTKAYVPEGPRAISSSQHDAQLSLAVILMGKPVAPVEGQDHKQVIEIWLAELDRSIASIEQRGGMARPDELKGLKNLSIHIKAQIGMVARDENEKEYVREQMDVVGRADNYLKAYEQRLMEAAKQKQAQGNGNGLDPKDAAKIQGMVLSSQVKAQNQRESHAQRAAQRDVAFQIDLRHKAVEHQERLRQQASEAAIEQHALDLKTAGEIKRDAAKSRMKSFSE